MLLDVDEPGAGKDQPESMRKATLPHLLRLANQNQNGIEPRLLAFYAYDVQGMANGLPDDCLTGLIPQYLRWKSIFDSGDKSRIQAAAGDVHTGRLVCHYP